MWNLKNTKTSKYNKKQTHTYREQSSGYIRETEEGRAHVGIQEIANRKHYKLLHGATANPSMVGLLLAPLLSCLYNINLNSLLHYNLKFFKKKTKLHVPVM